MAENIEKRKSIVGGIVKGTEKMLGSMTKRLSKQQPKIPEESESCQEQQKRLPSPDELLDQQEQKREQDQEYQEEFEDSDLLEDNIAIDESLVTKQPSGNLETPLVSKNVEMMRISDIKIIGYRRDVNYDYVKKRDRCTKNLEIAEKEREFGEKTC